MPDDVISNCDDVVNFDDVTRDRRCGTGHRCSKRFRLDLACSTRALIWRRYARRHGRTIDDDDGLFREIDEVLQFFRSLRSADFRTFSDSSVCGVGGGGWCIHLERAFKSLIQARSSTSERAFQSLHRRGRCRNSCNYDPPSIPDVHLDRPIYEGLFALSIDWPSVTLTVEIYYELCIRLIYSLSLAYFYTSFGRNLSQMMLPLALFTDTFHLSQTTLISALVCEKHSNTSTTHWQSFIRPL